MSHSSGGSLDHNLTPEEIKRLHDERVRRQIREIVGNYKDLSLREGEKESSTESVSERFDNQDEEAESPRVESPPLLSARLMAIEFDLKMSQTHHASKWGHIFLMLTMCVGITHVMEFYAEARSNGGFCYIIPFTFCMVFVSFPLCYLEMALGQYTSQHPVSLFQRISSIYGGVGYLMLFIRLADIATSQAEIARLVVLIDPILTVFLGEREQFCFKKYCKSKIEPCKPDEVYTNGNCYKVKDNTFLTTAQRYFLEMHKEPAFTDENEAWVEPNRLIDNSPANVNNLMAIFVFFMLVFIVSRKGMTFYATVAGGILLFSAVAITAMFIFTVAMDSNYFLHSLSQMGVRFDRLKDYKVWVTALQTALSVVCLGDGTLHSMGALSKFGNNVMRDAASLCIFAWVNCVISLFLLTPVSKFDSYSYGTQYMERSIHGTDDLIVYSLTYYGSLSNLHMIFIYAYSIAYVLLLVGYQVLAGQMIVQTLTHMFPKVLNTYSKVANHCMLGAYYLGMMLFYIICLAMRTHGFIMHKFASEIYLVTCTVVLVTELFIINYHYGVKRFIVNIITMVGKDVANKRYFAFINLACFVLMLTFIPCVLLMVTYVVFTRHHMMYWSFPIVLLLTINSLPVIYATREITRAWFRGARMTEFTRIHKKWGPLNMRNRLDAVFAERAARIFAA